MKRLLIFCILLVYSPPSQAFCGCFKDIKAAFVGDDPNDESNLTPMQIAYKRQKAREENGCTCTPLKKRKCHLCRSRKPLSEKLTEQAALFADLSLQVAQLAEEQDNELTEMSHGMANVADTTLGKALPGAQKIGLFKRFVNLFKPSKKKKESA